MNAFDSDVLTEVWLGNVAYVQRAEAIPLDQQAVPIVVAEEIVRGRLHAIRQAETGKGRITLEQAYHFLEHTLQDLGQVTILSYTAQAETLFQQWRQQKLRVATHDLRIAAICVVHSATLISRNRQDFERVPGLSVEFWG